MFFNVLLFVICYLICSINPAIVICKIKTGKDIRDLGSGNAGTTNSVRVLGRFLGSIVFILDVLKSVTSYLVVMLMCKIFKVELDIAAKSMFLVGAIIGHCFPIFYGFKGGKGIVTLLVASLFINRQIAVVCIIVGLIILIITRTVSKGTLSGVLLYVIMMFVMMPEYVLPVIVSSFIVFFRHKENIIRIMNKEEAKLF